MDKSVPQLTTTNQKVPARLGLLGGSTLTCSRNMNCFSFLSCLLSAMVPWRWNVSSRNRQACPSTKLQMSQTIQWDDINMLNQMCQIRKCIKKIYSIGQMRHDVGKCVVRGVCVCGGRGGGERYSDSFKHLFVSSLMLERQDYKSPYRDEYFLQPHRAIKFRMSKLSPHPHSCWKSVYLEK